MTSNKRIHELLEGIKNLREQHPNAALMISKGPGLDALWFGGLGILQHLLEVDIESHGGRKYCEKHNMDYILQVDDLLYGYHCTLCLKAKSQECKNE